MHFNTNLTNKGRKRSLFGPKVKNYQNKNFIQNYSSTSYFGKIDNYKKLIILTHDKNYMYAIFINIYIVVFMSRQIDSLPEMLISV